MLSTLPTPCLLIEERPLAENLRRGAQLAQEAGCRLRPHIKTHKCPDLARRQHLAGATGFTCATLAEAAALLNAGLDDIFLAYPVVGPDRVDAFLDLVRRGRVTCAVDHPEHLGPLAAAARHAGLTLGVLVEIDSGHHRCGLAPGPAVRDLGKLVGTTPGLRLEGVFTHAGHAYGAGTPEALSAIGRQEGEAVVAAAGMLREEGIEVPIVSVGSTPTMATSPFVSGVTEMRPGNYVFHDGMQVQLGVCGWADCALSVLATIIGVFADRVVIDAGSKAVGLDKGAHGLSLLTGFGFFPAHPDWVLSRLSEEHGVIDLPGAGPGGNPRVRVGERVRFIPNHACAAVNLHRFLHHVEGDQIVGRWEVAARR